MRSVPDPAAVRAEGLTHRYGGAAGGRAALRDLSLAVEAGETFALLGPNGSGKTTLFRILATLLAPTRGAAQVFGRRVTGAPGAVRQALGVAFQSPALDEALTVEENLRCHGAFFGMPSGALTDRITGLLERFELAGRRTDRVQTLSGGLRRRADLARALLHRPRLLLLDEPTAGLDPAARHAFWRHLARLQQQDGTTLLVATHLMAEAERADRVAILYEGERVACGPPDALKRELGDRALWITCTGDPDALRERLCAQMGLKAQRVGERLQIDHEDAPALLARIYDAFPSEIERATVRRPTLEDVFMARTGTSEEKTLADAEPSQLT
jgi:ABC-2 type transport system ATP-binding protein